MNDPTPPAPSTPPPLPPEPPPWRPINRRRWWFHLVIIGAYSPCIGLLGVLEGRGYGPALTHTVAGLLHVCAMAFLMFALWFFLGWFMSRANADDLLLRWRGGIWTVPLGLGYSIAIRIAVAMMAISFVLVLVAARVTTPDGIQRFLDASRPDVERLIDVNALRTHPAYYWLAVTLVSFVVAGCREELWRAGVLAGLQKLWPRTFGTPFGKVGAVTIAAVLFGLGHLPQGILGVIVTTAIGFGLGLIMVFHRSIWPAVIAHGAFDATSIGLLPWAMDRLPHMQHLGG